MKVKSGRNDPCPCGSGKKFKACCGQLASEVSADGSVTSAELNQLAALLNSRRYVELESKSLGLLQRYPDAGVVWQLLAVSLSKQGKDALVALERAAALLPQDAAAHNNLGNALAVLGRFDHALASFRKALLLRPGFAEAHNNIGNVRLDLGQLDQAAASYRQALELKPDYAEACNNLGHASRGLGRLEEAMASFRQAIALRPDFAEAYNSLGMVLRDLARLDEAVANYHRAIELNPGFADAHGNLAIALRLQGRTAEAEASCRQALQINPASAAAIVVLAESRADQGQFAEAEDLFKRAIALEPQSPEAWAGIPRLRRMTPDDSQWLAQALRIVTQSLSPRQEAPLRYAIAKYFDDVKEFEQAFVNYQRANQLTAEYRTKHDRQQLTQAVDRVIQSSGQRWTSQKGGDGNPSMRPVFIVGMVRSGTTLVEQILASHPAVFGAGELAFWNSTAAMYYSSALSGGISANILGKLADDYLRLLGHLSADALRVVDKMPANFLHMGLIHAALPNARFIHMQRDPIDTCLSIYFQHFETGHSYANDLGDLAHAYNQYLRVMAHWRLVLPANLVLNLPYEGLVADQEAWSRKIVEFVGLPWDPRCLEFERTHRTVITASKWQVRQRINTASIGRWRNYQKFLGPLRELTASSPR
jgi:tetratricopeptide (TPR) repeat protein